MKDLGRNQGFSMMSRIQEDVKDVGRCQVDLGRYQGFRNISWIQEDNKDLGR